MHDDAHKLALDSGVSTAQVDGVRALSDPGSYIDDDLHAIVNEHRNSGAKITRAEGRLSGTNVYVVSDPVWQRMFDALFDEAVRQSANAVKDQPVETAQGSTKT